MIPFVFLLDSDVDLLPKGSLGFKSSCKGEVYQRSVKFGYSRKLKSLLQMQPMMDAEQNMRPQVRFGPTINFVEKKTKIIFFKKLLRGLAVSIIIQTSI